MERTEFVQMRDKALEQLMKGQSLTGKDGVVALLLQQFLGSALESEMNTHLNEQERESGNKRNGKGSKRLKTMSGEIILITPEDRKSSFRLKSSRNAKQSWLTTWLLKLLDYTARE